MSPSIAVVIPAYNAELTIQAAIASVLSQTVPPQEVIVVDDGSSDGTAEVVERWGSRVKLLRQENQGSAAARQFGSDRAVSEYIAYLDADDWWPEDRLQACHSILGQEEVHFLFADLQRAHPGDTPDRYSARNSTYFPWVAPYLRNHAQTTSVEGLVRLESPQALQLLFLEFPCFPSTVLMRRDVVDAVGGWDPRFQRCQDFDFALRVARRFPIHYYDRVQAIIGLNEANSDGDRYIVMQTEGDIRVLHAHFEAEPAGSPYRTAVGKALAGKYCDLAYAHRRAERFGHARTAYFHALKWPGRRMHALPRGLAAAAMSLMGKIPLVG